MNKNSQKFSFNMVLECCAFFGIACIAIALVFAVCFQGSNTIYNAFKTVGDAIAYSLSMIMACFWVKRQKHIAWVICYVVFVVLIVVLYIVGIVRAF